jgi:hypothetical protein
LSHPYNLRGPRSLLRDAGPERDQEGE